MNLWTIASFITFVLLMLKLFVGLHGLTWLIVFSPLLLVLAFNVLVVAVVLSFAFIALLVASAFK